MASQFWNPATAASIPNLVPKDKLERANQLSLLTTYGTAPLAAGLFSVLALVSEGISRVTPLFHASNADLALYFNAASYGISALTVYFIREIPKRHASDKISVPSTFRSIWEGWQFIRQTPVVRGLVVGMVGAFSAAGVVVGLGFTYITQTLHGGSAGWGLVFAAIFVGMALGMAVGTRVLGNFSRRRLFGISIIGRARCRWRSSPWCPTSSWSRCSWSCSARCPGSPTRPASRSSGSRWTTTSAAGCSPSSSPPSRSSCSPLSPSCCSSRPPSPSSSAP